MSILTKVGSFLGGSVFREIKETAMAYFPPDMSPAQKAEAERAIDNVIIAKQAQANEAIAEDNRAAETAMEGLNKRIAEQEGTVSDLKSIPIIGTFIIFLRGCQRPVWGFGTLIMDFKWFFGAGTFTEQQQTALIFINIIVLTFLFGERTIKNLEPLLSKLFAKK
jgi:hypothetical protein